MLRECEHHIVHLGMKTRLKATSAFEVDSPPKRTVTHVEGKHKASCGEGRRLGVRWHLTEGDQRTAPAAGTAFAPRSGAIHRNRGS